MENGNFGGERYTVSNERTFEIPDNGHWGIKVRVMTDNVYEQKNSISSLYIGFTAPEKNDEQMRQIAEEDKESLKQKWADYIGIEKTEVKDYIDNNNAKTLGKLYKDGLQLKSSKTGEVVHLNGVSLFHLLDYGDIYTKESLETLKYWGINCIRIPAYLEEKVSSNGDEITPLEKGLDTSMLEYFEKMDKIIEDATDLGIYCVVDFHDMETNGDIIKNFAKPLKIPTKKDLEGNVIETKDYNNWTELSIDYFKHFGEKYGEQENILWEIAGEPFKTSSIDLANYTKTITNVIKEYDYNPVIMVGVNNGWCGDLDELYEIMLENDPENTKKSIFLSMHYYYHIRFYSSLDWRDDEFKNVNDQMNNAKKAWNDAKGTENESIRKAEYDNAVETYKVIDNPHEGFIKACQYYQEKEIPLVYTEWSNWSKNPNIQKELTYDEEFSEFMNYSRENNILNMAFALVNSNKYPDDNGMNVWNGVNELEINRNLLKYGAGSEEYLSENGRRILSRFFEEAANINRIEYNLAGGEIDEEYQNPARFITNEKDITLINPIREGYIFTGWTGTNLEAPTKTVTIAKEERGNRTYTANWEKINVLLKDYSNYSVKKDENVEYITGIAAKTSIEEIKNNFVDDFEIKVFDNDNEITNNNEIGKTNMKIKFYNENAEVTEYIIVVKGDCNGSGTVNVADLTTLMISRAEELANNKNESKILNGAFKYAVDLNNDNRLNSSDITLLSKYIADNK